MLCCFLSSRTSTLTSGATAAAIGATCADARPCSATAIAAGTTGATEDSIVRNKVCIISVAAIAAVGSLTARGVDGAAADEVERVARCQLNTCAATCGSAGIGSRAGKRYARGDVEIYRTQDGQAAAASVAVGEREIAVGIVISGSTCCTQRLP